MLTVYALLVAAVPPAIFAAAKIAALLIALRGTRPAERAVLIEAVAELFRTGPWPRAHRRRPPQPGRRRLTGRGPAPGKPPASGE